MIRTLIVDDDPVTVSLFEGLIEKTGVLTHVASCVNGIDAANLLLQEEIDLIFLDVEMPEMSGIDLLKTLVGKRPQVILITNKKEYAIEAFDYDVTDYLVKPITYDRFLQAVNKVKRRAEAMNPTPQAKKQSEQTDLFIKADGRLQKIDMREIRIIEALADYVCIHTPSKKYTIHATMKSMEAKLPENDFLRIHNSYIVRLDKIQEIEDNCVVIGEKLIPVSRSNKKSLMNRLRML